MDEESTQLEMTDFAISDAVIDTAEPFVSYAASRGKTLELDIAPDLTYHGNEGCIRQCVSLLLDNAIKYSTENGKLRLTFHKQGRALALTVWNRTSADTQELHRKGICATSADSCTRFVQLRP